MTARLLATLLFSTTFLLAGCSSGGGSTDAYPVDVSGAQVSSRSMENGDLLVMTSHGHRGISRVLLGSQTMEVLARCKVPVLVVR